MWKLKIVKMVMRFEADAKPFVSLLFAYRKADKAAPVVRTSGTDWFCSVRHSGF